MKALCNRIEKRKKEKKSPLKTVKIKRDRKDK